LSIYLLSRRKTCDYIFRSRRKISKPIRCHSGKGVSMRSTQDRFEEKVSIEPNSGCWLWTGAANAAGYGRLYVWPEGKHQKAHRISYELHVGAIPDGMFVCHRCDNPSCVNPQHLFIGTRQDNVDDMNRKGRHRNQKKTHCPKGHAFTPDNLAAHELKRSGGRTCKTCERARSLRRSMERTARRKASVAATKAVS